MSDRSSSVLRVRLWYALLMLVLGVFLIRLFYLQVIKHDYYKRAALQGQLKQYEIPAERGIIEAHDGGNLLPIVLNDIRYTLFVDPKFIKDPAASAIKLEKIVGGKASDYEKSMRANSRYAVLAKKLTPDQKKAVDNLKIAGVGTREERFRTYPQDNLAAQVLGFVNDDGVGTYGIEQALDDQLRGVPGELKAITDAQGVPLVTSKDNVVKEAVKGQRVILTLDISMQKQVQDILKSGLDAAKSTSGSVLVMDPKTGAIKAMANYPTYNPNEFYKIEDPSIFNNSIVSSPLEVGSIMKSLTAAAALDLGVVSKNTSYYDPSRFVVDDHTIKNIEEDGGAGTRNVADILQLSLNTGATWLLMQMGGGEINTKARTAWHSYLGDHYQFGKPTGIEQGYEEPGSLPDAIKGFGLDLQYANMSFGQGMNITPLQFGAALSSVLNGGTYYRPRIVDQTIDASGKVRAHNPDVVKTGVVKPEVSETMQELMEYVVTKNHLVYGMPKLPNGYSIGGKTGTAEVPKPGGGYYDDRFNGTFAGFVGGDAPEYVIVVRVNEPKIGGYAGARAAAPIFSKVSTMLIDNFAITPKTQ